MVLLISYDLIGHERPTSYEAVKRAIESRATSFKRPLFSQWLVETSSDASVWWGALKTVIDSNDKVFISRVRPPAGTEYSGWLSKDVWEWLRARA